MHCDLAELDAKSEVYISATDDDYRVGKAILRRMDELQSLCRANRLAVSGTRAQMSQRLSMHFAQKLGDVAVLKDVRQERGVLLHELPEKHEQLCVALDLIITPTHRRPTRQNS